MLLFIYNINDNFELQDHLMWNTAHQFLPLSSLYLKCKTRTDTK